MDPSRQWSGGGTHSSSSHGSLPSAAAGLLRTVVPATPLNAREAQIRGPNSLSFPAPSTTKAVHVLMATPVPAAAQASVSPFYPHARRPPFVPNSFRAPLPRGPFASPSFPVQPLVAAQSSSFPQASVFNPGLAGGGRVMSNWSLQHTPVQ